MTNTRDVCLVDRGQGLVFTESPRWSNGKWWFLDIHGQAIRTVDTVGNVSTVVELPFKPNGFGILEDGTLMFGDALGRKVYRYSDKILEMVADISDLTVFCLSDGIVDSHGRMYIGDIGYNFFDPLNQAVDTCVIIRIDPNGRAIVVARDLTFPNGMVITPDEKTLVVAECKGHRLTAYDIDTNGSLSNRRVFAQFEDDVHPDGICMDQEGAIWIANPEGKHSLMRVCEGGEIIKTVDLETQAYAVMLGGANGKSMLVCASDSHDPAALVRSPCASLLVLELE